MAIMHYALCINQKFHRSFDRPNLSLDVKSGYSEKEKIAEIVSIILYSDFKENEYCQIHDNEDFIYREYCVTQPLQRSYAINEERIKILNRMAKASLQNRGDILTTLGATARQKAWNPIRR